MGEGGGVWRLVVEWLRAGLGLGLGRVVYMYVNVMLWWLV